MFVDFAVISGWCRAPIEGPTLACPGTYLAMTIHVPDQGQAKQRRILAVIPAARTNRFLGVARPGKQFCDHAFIDPVTLDEHEPADRLAGLPVELLPEAAHRWFCRGGTWGDPQHYESC